MKMRDVVILAGVVAATFTAPTPGLAQEREWSLDATDKEAFLVFGVPDTDDVGLSFWCAIGTGKASLYLPLSAPILKDGERTQVKVSIDGKSFSLNGKAAREGNDARMTVEAPFRLTDKVMAALKAGEGIAVAVKGRTSTFPLTDADFDGLVNACNGAAQDSSDN